MGLLCIQRQRSVVLRLVFQKNGLYNQPKLVSFSAWRKGFIGFGMIQEKHNLIVWATHTLDADERLAFCRPTARLFMTTIQSGSGSVCHPERLLADSLSKKPPSGRGRRWVKRVAFFPEAFWLDDNLNTTPGMECNKRGWIKIKIVQSASAVGSDSREKDRSHILRDR